MPQRDDYEFVHILGAATTVISGVACKLINVSINTPGGSVSVYNAATSVTASSSNTVGIVASGTIAGVYLSDGKKLATGMVVVTGAGNAAQSTTIVYATA